MTRSDTSGSELTCQIGPKCGLVLDMVTHCARDAGDRPNGKQDGQPNLLRKVQFDFVQDNEWDR